jgi:hypothetical protein
VLLLCVVDLHETQYVDDNLMNHENWARGTGVMGNWFKVLYKAFVCAL